MGRPRSFPGIGVLLLIGVFSYLLAFPLALNPADESYLLYGAKRILQGQAIYRDFFEFITPGAFYLFALAFRLGGTSIVTARMAMAAANAVGCTLLYLLARQVSARAEAALVALLFAAGCLPVWNVASPHWLSTTYCLGAAAALLSDRLSASTALRPALAGAITGLTLCNQQQRGVFLGVWLVIAVLVIAGVEPGPDRRVRCARELMWAFGGWGIVVLAIMGYTLRRASLAEVLDATLFFVLTGYWHLNVGKVGWGGAVGLTALGPEYSEYSWRWLAWLIPCVLAVETMLLGWTLRRRFGRPEAIRITLLLLAALMSASIFYYPDVIHVAFIAPFSLVVGAGLLYRLRSSLSAHRGRVIAFAIRAAFAVAFIAIALKGGRTLRSARARAPERVPTAFGTIAATPAAHETFERIAMAVSGVPADRRRIFSYPVDASFYLTLPADDATPFSLLLPGYSRPEHFRAAIEAIRQGKADFVVVNSFFSRPGDPVVTFVQRNFGPPIGGHSLYAVYGPIRGALDSHRAGDHGSEGRRRATQTPAPSSSP